MRINPKNLLLPYLENQLDPARQENLAALLAADPALAEEARRLRRVADTLRQTAARAPADSTADHWPALRARLILAPAPRRAVPWGWAASGAALAAALVAAFAFVWVPMHGTPRTPHATARPAPVSVPAPVSAPAASAPIQKSAPQKVAAAPKPLPPTRYSYLALAQSLPYVQANPLVRPPAAQPPARPFLRRPRRSRPRFARLQKPAVPRTAPVLAAAKPHAARPAGTAPVIIPTQDSAPPLTVPAASPPPVPASPVSPSRAAPGTPETPPKAKL